MGAGYKCKIPKDMFLGEKLALPRIIVFDLETRRLASQLHPHKDEGWRRLKEGKGGVSALVIHDLLDDWSYIYDDHEIEAVARRLEEADVVVGFRSDGFDIPVIEGLMERKLAIKESIDLYGLIRKALGKKGIVGKRGEYTLDAVCKRTIGQSKNEKGTHAPQLAAEGQFGRLFRYCMNDVKLTRDLFGFVQWNGFVRSVQGNELKIELPKYLQWHDISEDTNLVIVEDSPEDSKE